MMRDFSTSEITFRLLTGADLETYRSWFADAELAGFIDYPTDDWFAHVTGSDNAQCWAVVAPDGVMLAEIQVDRDEVGVGHIELAVRPDLRGNGYGKRILFAFLRGPGGIFAELHAHIEISNVASLACFQRCDFVEAAEQDDDEFRLLLWRPKA
ncbi:RimJ/RimL family protein N-acetyltransferase [Ensifer adhaerens]|uniref:RimJ/RimL family protein N-acetyltransferase n=1 Tax=Ensifer adhaerens TaxID=106592 RepID=A0ACC5STR9_ENSAD|nr:GNAT family N-acetyltransferase [Ensifer adhaerens]MBP1872278.1 RimJ/RimL family protein N-acetyltransferase [Ensifer adhaerens]